MLVRLAIITDRHPSALVVPKRALRREGDSSFVFIVEDGSAERHEVREGFSTDEDVEILPVREDVLDAGMAVVVAGNRDLEDGADVLAEDLGPETGALASGEESE
jgi:multidrug efflux pump subunit AcrA (membrane-fusion protein)